MKIKLKNSKTDVKEIEVKNEIILLKTSLEDEYQNSLDIKNVVMENDTYGNVGCRAISAYRSSNQQMKSNISMKEFDELADEGGMKLDSWVDDYKNPIYNVLAIWSLVDKINKKYNVNLGYKLIQKSFTDIAKQWLYNCIINDVSLIIKMKNLVYENSSHFVNVDGVIKEDDGKIYFRMKESYDNYDGYDGYFVDINVPAYYEIIYDKKLEKIIFN
jgi:hypothetical protein